MSVPLAPVNLASGRGKCCSGLVAKDHEIGMLVQLRPRRMGCTREFLYMIRVETILIAWSYYGQTV